MNRDDDTRIAVRVWIAEPLLRAGVRATLAAARDIGIVDADLDGDSDSDNGWNDTADVAVVDSDTAAQLAADGRPPAHERRVASTRILLIAPQAGEHAVRSAMEQGVRGFVLTSSPVEDLLEGIRVLARGGTYLCAPALRRLARLPERDMLTGREAEVLHWLAIGLSNKSIAVHLDIAVGTVKAHVRSIMAKLDAGCRTEAARIATERGLVDLAAPVWTRGAMPGAVAAPAASQEEATPA